MSTFKALLIVLLLTVPAFAKPLQISRDYGGDLEIYLNKYADLRDAGIEVEILDICLSACTLVLAVMDDDKICAYPKAVFGFHSAAEVSREGKRFAKEQTRMIWNMYPVEVRERLKELGWDGDGDKEHPELVYIKGTDLVRQCEG